MDLFNGDEEKVRELDRLVCSKMNFSESYWVTGQTYTRKVDSIILNTLSGKYEFGKRPKSLLKVKQFHDADVLCIGIQEGEGSMKGMLGAIKCQFLYNGEVQDVEVGTGFKQDERIEIYNNPSLVLNKVITIKMFEISRNSSTGKYSLRFPSWQGMEYIREDKYGIENTNVD